MFNYFLTLSFVIRGSCVFKMPVSSAGRKDPLQLTAQWPQCPQIQRGQEDIHRKHPPSLVRIKDRVLCTGIHVDEGDGKGTWMEVELWRNCVDVERRVHH